MTDSQWKKSDIGTVLECGCEVEHHDIGCEDHDYPDTGCGDCRFGVPAVLHECQDGPNVYDEDETDDHGDGPALEDVPTGSRL